LFKNAEWNYDSARAFSPDDKSLAVAGANGTFTLWDLVGMRPKAVLMREQKDEAQGAAFSPDAQSLATFSPNGSAKLWNLTAHTSRDVLPLQRRPTHSGAFSSDGRRLAIGAGDGTVRITDVSTSHPVCTLRGHGHIVYAVFFADTNTLVTASRDRVMVWRVPSFAEIDSAEKAQAAGVPAVGK
jgi:WD40 repeat protein